MKLRDSITLLLNSRRQMLSLSDEFHPRRTLRHRRRSISGRFPSLLVFHWVRVVQLVLERHRFPRFRLVLARLWVLVGREVHRIRERRVGQGVLVVLETI